MKKVAALTFVFAICLYAADFWQAKLFTDWNDKELQRMSESSPWAKQVSVSMGGGVGTTDSSSSKGGRSKGGGGGGGGGSMPNDLAGEGGGSLAAGGAGGMSLMFTVRWQSALPVKQALVKMKYGAEAGTSAEAKQILGATEPDYVIVVAGLNRNMVRGEADKVKEAMMAATELIVKGKEPIKPRDFRMVGQGRVDAIFAFPRTNPIVEDDKDVEFSCKVGGITLKQKFRLKDMLFNGKLEL
jgi:hypothetical protein